MTDSSIDLPGGRHSAENLRGGIPLNKAASRFTGLDSIRFFCALWVVFGHCGGFSLPRAVDASYSAGHMVNRVLGVLYSGPAAVIVFFVVSGFCIHFPFRHAAKLPVLSYLVRRYVRIGIPVIVAMGLALWLDVPALLLHRTSFALSLPSIRRVADGQTGLIWSLVCEGIYYGLYPLFFLIRRRVGWKPLLAFSFAMACFVILLHPGAGNYNSYGHFLNWILGLPCWLLGCQLAESLDCAQNRPPTAPQIWLLRLLVWGTSICAMLLRFHSPIGYPWTLTVFSGLCFWWLLQELRYHQAVPPLRIFEWAGAWSYSIYLGHALVFPLLARIGMPFDFSTLGASFDWLLRTLLILAFCWLFYLLFERPSHLLARSFGSRLAKVQPV